MSRREQTRAFRPDFLIHIAPYGGLPPLESIRIWGKPRRLRFIRNGDYSPIRSGGAGKVRHLRLVVLYMIDPAHRNFDEWRGLSEYLSQHGVAKPETAGVDAVMELVTTDEEGIDQGMDPKGLAWVFDRIVQPVRFVRPFAHDEPEVVPKLKEAIGWVCIDAGRQVAGKPDLPPFEALDVAEKRMGASLGEYQKRILALWERNEWVVVRAVKSGEVKGVAINFPVTQGCYDRFRAGKGGRPYECDPSCIEPGHSRWVLVEALATTAFEHSHARRPGFSLLMAILCQQARLTDVPGCPENDPLHLLSFTGTPVGEARLRRFKYEYIDQMIEGTDIKLMERVLHLDGAGLVDSWLIGIWQGMQKELRRDYPSVGGVVVRPRADSPVIC